MLHVLFISYFLILPPDHFPGFFCNNPNLCSSLSVTDQVSRPYETNESVGNFPDGQYFTVIMKRQLCLQCYPVRASLLTFDRIAFCPPSVTDAQSQFICHSAQYSVFINPCVSCSFSGFSDTTRCSCRGL